MSDPQNPPKGNPPPDGGGNHGLDPQDPDPDPRPEPPAGAIPPEPLDSVHSPPTAAATPVAAQHLPSDEEEHPPSEGIMKPGLARLLVLLAFLVMIPLSIYGAYRLWFSGPTMAQAIGAPGTPGSPSAAIPTLLTPVLDASYLTPAEAQRLCTGPAAENQFLVGRVNGTTDPVVAPLCGGLTEFRGYDTTRARVIANNLIVTKSQALTGVFGNTTSYVGEDKTNGAQSAKAHFPMSHWFPGKTQVRVILHDGTPVIVQDPLLVLTGQNGGDMFDQICQPYRDMAKAPEIPWEAEIWSRCRRTKTATNVATTQTIIKYVRENPGVSRDDFRKVADKVEVLGQQVVAAGNKPIEHPKVSTGVGTTN